MYVTIGGVHQCQCERAAGHLHFTPAALSQRISLRFSGTHRVEDQQPHTPEPSTQVTPELSGQCKSPLPGTPSAPAPQAEEGAIPPQQDTKASWDPPGPGPQEDACQDHHRQQEVAVSRLPPPLLWMSGNI